jgi:filamentous hemagglutinin family protein
VKFSALPVSLALLSLLSKAQANPVGPTVTQGNASFSSQGSHLTIQTSDRAFINWQSFNIGLGETTSFLQPSSSSLVWNQIHDPNPSQILGNLNANGYVVLQNSSGFFIGGQASITARGLLMTTAPIAMPDLAGAGAWSFNAPPPAASIINYGQINLSRGGSAFLIAHDIENRGAITAPEGNIGLYAGKQVLISDRPNGGGLSAKVTLPDGSVDNSGRLVADAGTIAMHAQVVNQGGLIQANSVREVNGTIELVASDAVNLGSHSVIQAKGDAQGASAGGSVVIKSDGSFVDQPGSTINVAGGPQGGNGGQVELSASRMNSIQTTFTGRAIEGFTSGQLFIDPANILLTDHGDSAPSSGTVNPADPPSAGSPDTLTLNVNTFNNLISQNALSQINLQATKDIELNTLWNLPDSQDPNASLTLQAGRNITLDDAAGVAAGKNWSVNMLAGPQNLSAKPSAGTDGIYLNGSAFIQAQNGNIKLWAGNEVIVNQGNTGDVGNNGIRTLAGGSISVTTLYGDVNAGANSQGYSQFRTRAPYNPVSPLLGGISTAAGGDVTISAGGNVISFLPPSGSGSDSSGDAGSGAFGPEPGNVTITAGGSVFGHYVTANGTGKITAGVNVGGADASQNVALSMASGSWSVNAQNGSIYLQEVRNPNGVFNDTSGSISSGYHYFDYSPNSSVSLTAGVGVYLTGLNLPRPSGDVPVIFPPTLDITAGPGGITMGDTVILFPSPQGELHLTTTGGGTLAAVPNNPQQPAPELIMSDSSQTRWLDPSTFGDTDHGNVPPELNNPNPVLVNVSGNMKDMILITSKQTHLTVGGDMLDCSFSGQNLHQSDITSINVGGQIFNRSPYSFVILAQAIQNLPSSDTALNSPSSWDSVFSAALDPSLLASLQIPANLPLSQVATYVSQNAALFPSGNPGFVYNPSTLRLGFSGQMSQSVRADLESPLTVLRYGPDGNPILDSSGHPLTDQVTFVNRSVVETLYQSSQGAPSASAPAALGYRIGGPGQFNVQGGSISLGNTYGILSCGVGDPAGNRYSNLAPYTKEGATVNVNVAGDLSLLTSTIAALGGGDVNVSSTSGSMDLGSQELFNVQRGVGLGVYTSGRGNVNVTAFGDINIDGSRVAAYNGGNLAIKSLTGNVNAGSGGTTFVSVPVTYVDPATGLAGFYQEEVFGSGIVANTLVKPGQVPGSATVPGNITVETPRGNIFASQGGIVQEALNGNVSAGPTITLVAGTRPTATDPGYTGNIDLGQSGVIGGTVNIDANGNITGLVISRQNTSIKAAQSFSGTVLSGGTANLSAGGSISGTVVGIGGVNASSGQGISAALLGQNVSVGGGAAQSTLGTTATATSASQAAAAQASNDAKEQVSAEPTDDSQKKNKTKGPTLVRRTGRVTVILPPSS